jgi:phosphatidylserine decarboxylase
MTVSEIYEPDFLKSKAIKISIFLSIFNVHINRSPINGIVKFTSYRPGKYLPAFKSHASEINERNTVAIEGKKAKVLVHQLTGFIARRIVCWVKEGDNLEAGERFGLIKFGSCTELIVPADVDIRVNPGSKVKGGKTIIGVIN